MVSIISLYCLKLRSHTTKHKNSMSEQAPLLRTLKMLIEEYPLSEKFTRKTGENSYLLETRVCDMAGVGRFVLGLPGEITIVGPAALKDYVRERVKEYGIR